MWKYFLARDKVMEVTDEQAQELAQITGRETGAFIDKFSESYNTLRRHQILEAKGYSSLVEALKKGVQVSSDEVRGSIQYEILKADLQQVLEAKRKRTANGETHRRIGFAQ